MGLFLLIVRLREGHHAAPITLRLLLTTSRLPCYVSARAPSRGLIQMPKYKYSLVACARWEADDIVEWIEYHRHIGFEHFYIYSNDDSPDVLFKTLLPYILGDDPIVTFTHWSKIGEQSEMYANFLGRHKTETQWAMFLDIDEFVTLRKHDTIMEFIDTFDATVDCIYFNWLNFGNNHKIHRDKKSILGTLTRRSVHIDPHTKTIFKTKKVTEALAREGAANTGYTYTHFWNDYPFGNFVIRDVLNRSVENYAKDFPDTAYRMIQDQNISNLMIETAHISHFVIKSEDDFIRRAERGGFVAQEIWRQKYISGEYKEMLARFNEIEDNYLSNIWHNMTLNRLAHGSRQVSTSALV